MRTWVDSDPACSEIALQRHDQYVHTTHVLIREFKNTHLCGLCRLYYRTY